MKDEKLENSDKPGQFIVQSSMFEKKEKNIYSISFHDRCVYSSTDFLDHNKHWQYLNTLHRLRTSKAGMLITFHSTCGVITQGSS